MILGGGERLLSEEAPVAPFRPPGAGDIALGREEFGLLRDLIRSRTGITFGPAKRELVGARVGKRLRALGLRSYGDYLQRLMLRDSSGEEMSHLIDVITTTKTGFFREPQQFEYMAREWLPRLEARARETGERRLRIWSAACSSGEEPYTIAIVLREALGAAADSWDVKILASDINTIVLAKAAAGVYALGQMAEVPERILKRYFLRGVGSKRGFVQVRPEIRRMVGFRRINLSVGGPAPEGIDAAFCRNVLIYFDADVQKRVVVRLLSSLREDGALFLGQAEHMHGWMNGLRSLGHAIYTRGETGASCAA